MSRLFEKIKLFDDLLVSIGQPITSSNPVFTIDEEMSCENFTRIFINKNKCVSLVFDVSLDGINIHIDGSSEVFSWGNDFIRNSYFRVCEILKIILISDVEIKSFGRGFKIIKFKKIASNQIIFSIKVFDSLFANLFNTSVRSYPAIFECN